MTNVEQNHVAGRPRTLATAIEYIGRNWVVIPIALHEKRLSIPGWQNLRIVGEDAHKYFNGKPQNIGVLLGAASGGLVDIDLEIVRKLQCLR